MSQISASTALAQACFTLLQQRLNQPPRFESALDFTLAELHTWVLEAPNDAQASQWQEYKDFRRLLYQGDLNQRFAAIGLQLVVAPADKQSGDNLNKAHDQSRTVDNTIYRLQPLVNNQPHW